MARIFMRGFEQGHMMVDRRVTQGLLEADHLDDDQEHRFTQVALEADHLDEDQEHRFTHGLLEEDFDAALGPEPEPPLIIGTPRPPTYEIHLLGPLGELL
jgi:hypothetical protein